jgi:hypothetical protein
VPIFFTVPIGNPHLSAINITVTLRSVGTISWTKSIFSFATTVFGAPGPGACSLDGINLTVFKQKYTEKRNLTYINVNKQFGRTDTVYPSVNGFYVRENN